MGKKDYLGWKNRETWNVALWINNDEYLANAANDFMQTYTGRRPYVDFITAQSLASAQTYDGVWYMSKKLALGELNEFMSEFKE